MCSWLAAIVAGLTRDQGFSISYETVLTIIGLAFLINSKNPLASFFRSSHGPERADAGKREHLLWSLFFTISGALLLLPFLIDGLPVFAVFSLLIFSYALLLYRGKEHHLATELNGFALLTLSAPIVYFAMTGEMSMRLYTAVLIFFAAGVFKVRVRTRKTMKYRQLMILYCAAAVILFLLMDIQVILLLPLVENVWTVLFMREEKLRATGYTELVKALIFVVLIAVFWS